MDPRAETPHRNRLARERSPYLRQHAGNPVDWHPWGPEALERARAEDRPIFLSVGYATCHWCHVMERESFASEAMAELINRHFVPIKVDREERPDLDQLYMTAVQALTGGGGWPMTLFLTPDGRPFYGGTYFPPQDRWGMPGLATLLQRLGEDWHGRREPLLRAAARMTELLRELGGAGSAEAERPARGPDSPRTEQPARDAPSQATHAFSLPDRLSALPERAFAELRARYDWTRGGFGSAPKFPAPHQLLFLLRHAAHAGCGEALDMVRGTLEAMASGGIHDQLGGGFHRYATDAGWLIPHFEKTLYDQAGLALAYTEAWRVTGDELYEEIARSTLDYVLRDLSHPEGGFCSGEDADSLDPGVEERGNSRGTARGAEPEAAGHGAGYDPDRRGASREGGFYVWSAAEVDRLLGPERGGEFAAQFGVTPSGNWEGTNILTRRALRPRLTQRLAESRRALLEARGRRPRPARDEKVIAAWNGYLIEALARAGAAWREPRYLDAAEKAAEAVTRSLEAEQRLRRYALGGAAPVPAFLDDFAFLGRGLLALHAARAESSSFPALDLARRLGRQILALFARPDGRLSYTGSDAEVLIAPLRDEADGALPSGTSAAAVLLLRLGREAGEANLRAAGIGILRALEREATAAPLAHLELLSSLVEELQNSGPEAVGREAH